MEDPPVEQLDFPADGFDALFEEVDQDDMSEMFIKVNGPGAPKDLPAFLLPIRDRRDWGVGGGYIPMFQDLSEHTFTPSDKDALLSIYYCHKQGLYKHVVGDTGFSIKRLAEAYSLKPDRIKKWHRNLKRSIPNTNKTGRPKLLHDEDIKDIRRQMKVRKNKRSVMSKDEVWALVEKKIKERWELQGIIGSPSILRQTFDSIVKRYLRPTNVKGISAQGSTPARKKAATDIRNFYSMMVGLSAFVTACYFTDIWNFDCTNFEIRKDGTGQVYLILSKKKQERFMKSEPGESNSNAESGCDESSSDESCDPCDSDPSESDYSEGGSSDSDSSEMRQNEVPATTTQSNQLATFIKYFCCSSASGMLCPTLLLCANKHCKSKETFFVKACQGLRISPDPNAADGYVAFTQTRAGNNRLFQWYFKTVVIPTLVRARGERVTPIFLSLDGEKLVVDSLLDFCCDEDPTPVRDLLAHYNIMVGKLPASWSLSGQPNDVGPIFKVLKMKVRQYVKDSGGGRKGTRRDDPLLQNELQNLWKDYQTEYPHDVSSASSEMKLKAFAGIQKIAYAIRHNITAGLLIRGFELVGQIRDQNGKFDFETLIAMKPGEKVKRSTFDKMLQHLQDDTMYMQSHGNLPDAKMKWLKNSNSEGDMRDRDDVNLINQRFVLLTHADQVRRYENEKRRTIISVGGGAAAGTGGKKKSKNDDDDAEEKNSEGDNEDDSGPRNNKTSVAKLARNRAYKQKMKELKKHMTSGSSSTQAAAATGDHIANDSSGAAAATGDHIANESSGGKRARSSTTTEGVSQQAAQSRPKKLRAAKSSQSPSAAEVVTQGKGESDMDSANDHDLISI